jgi:Ca2+-binding EF-hand superfamily protein
MQMIMRASGQNSSEEQILQIMKEIDPKSQGETDFEGFLKLMRKRIQESAEMDEELYEAFKTFDTKNRGYYDINEMKEMMAKYGEKLTDREAELLFKDIDLDDDGKITFEDFVLMMMAR